MRQRYNIHTWTNGRRTQIERIYTSNISPTRKIAYDDVEFLGFNKLVGVYSLSYKILWFIALVVSTSLCLWQVSECLTKFFSGPIGTETRVKIFNRYTLPSITICPSTLNFGYDFTLPFEKKCEKNERCRKLNDTERMKFPFHELNTSLTDLWLAKKIQLEVLLKCQFSINTSHCEREKKRLIEHSDNYRDTIAGNCYLVYSKVVFAYTGKTVWPWVLKGIKMDETLVENSNYFIDSDVRASPVVEKSFIGYQSIKKGCANRMELAVTEFRYLNTSKNPCTDEEKVSTCINKCFEDQFNNHSPSCKWPFLDIDLPLCNTLAEVEDFRTLMVRIKLLLSQCKCGRSCDYTAYSSSLTSYEGVNQTVIGVVLASNTKEIVTELYTYGFSSCLADLGGSIGIFLGISLLTVLDFLHTLIKKCIRSSH